MGFSDLRDAQSPEGPPSLLEPTLSMGALGTLPYGFPSPNSNFSHPPTGLEGIRLHLDPTCDQDVCVCGVGMRGGRSRGQCSPATGAESGHCV